VQIDGLTVGVFLPINAAEFGVLVGKVTAALGLIREYSPVRYQRVRRDLRGVLVLGSPDALGEYHSDLGLCELYVHHLKAPTVGPGLVASSIVHEAEHARLTRLGFGYAPEVQHRVERICHRAERVFGKRIPEADAVIQQASEGMAVPPGFYGSRARERRHRHGLRQLASDNAGARLVLWLYNLWTKRQLQNERRRRAAQHRDAADKVRV
jgi:hypothetical protein